MNNESNFNNDPNLHTNEEHTEYSKFALKPAIYKITVMQFLAAALKPSLVNNIIYLGIQLYGSIDTFLDPIIIFL